MVLVGIVLTILIFMCNALSTIVCRFSFFLLIIAFFVLRVTAPDYTFGIFTPFPLLARWQIEF